MRSLTRCCPDVRSNNHGVHLEVGVVVQCFSVLYSFLLQINNVNNKFTKSSAVNLVFISGDMDDIDFLHTYDLRTKDVATKEYHEAVGMMGFGGKYNFYFFLLGFNPIPIHCFFPQKN